jgi:hypothetical protein
VTAPERPAGARSVKGGGSVSGKPFIAVEVVWGDAWISTDDISVKKAKSLKPVKRRTIGYLVAENVECVVLCTDIYDTEPKTVNAPMVIPWGWVYEYYEYESL